MVEKSSLLVYTREKKWFPNIFEEFYGILKKRTFFLPKVTLQSISYSSVPAERKISFQYVLLESGQKNSRIPLEFKAYRTFQSVMFMQDPKRALVHGLLAF